MTNTKTKKTIKPNFMDLADALIVLCRAEVGGAYLASLASAAVGSHEDAEPNLSQLIARTSNPVIRMLAKQAMATR